MPLGKCGNLINICHFKGKRVLITGHTGFKGAWLSKILSMMGAEVYGYSLDPPTDPNLYTIANIGALVDSEYGDVLDFDHLKSFFNKVGPELVIHLAAQPLVREGYLYPRETYETNVMGTVNILECIRKSDKVKSFLNVTTDKVYENDESGKRYVESDSLNGYDPYSNSKSCSELVTQTYKRSYFQDGRCQISTARAGNVIGGGDFAKNRILPDCIKSAINNKDIILRNPSSIRPYQHVLEPLYAYLTILSMQIENPLMSGNYNVGPDKNNCVTTGELASIFCKHWDNKIKWVVMGDDGPHEAQHLELDNSLIKEKLNVIPKWTIEDAVIKTIEWAKQWNSGGNVCSVMERQIKEYFGEIL